MAAPANYSVTFTSGLIEKLAGVKKPVARERQFGPPSPSTINPEVLALKRSNAHLGSALESSKRVGTFLLKNEEQELRKVSQLMGELLKEHSYPPKPIPCGKERQECVGCYKANMENPLACADAVDAYSRCASSAYSRAMGAV